ncbi:DUF5753 domain-containing protein, partial [Amycolatopsis sp. CA-128772]|uniref:DUF5753 domain-containing protein n=1 Tax=Amycolatopsis sp. CA-128772 TaxID=2073159 RepID=UPI001E332D4E
TSLSKLPDPEVEARVTLRVGRRRALTRRNAPEMLALIGEGALRSMTGGPEVMRDQLDMLLKLERELPNLRIKVVELGVDYHDGSNGPFHLYRFANRTPIVYCEHLRGSVFITERFDVEAYESTVGELVKLAVDDEPEKSDKSLALIASIRDSL